MSKDIYFHITFPQNYKSNEDLIEQANYSKFNSGFPAIFFLHDYNENYNFFSSNFDMQKQSDNMKALLISI